MTQIIAVISMIADTMAISFDCFGYNLGCGQSISKTAIWFLQAANSLILAIDVCGINDPMKGFQCYARIWHVIQRLMKASKFIDVTIDLCPNPDGAPKEEDDLPPNPENPPIAHKVNGTEATTTEAPLGAWAGLQMVLDPEVAAVAGPAVERRLRGDQRVAPAANQSHTAEEWRARVDAVEARLTQLPGFTKSLPDAEDDDFVVPETLEDAEKMMEQLFKNMGAGEDQQVAREFAEYI